MDRPRQSKPEIRGGFLARGNSRDTLQVDLSYYKQCHIRRDDSMM